MATGAPGSNGVWVYGEDDSEATFSALLNKAASTTNTQLGLDRARLAVLEQTGRVVQVVNASTTTSTTITTSTATDTTLTATITPKFSSSKILVVVSQLMFPTSTSNTYTTGYYLVRGTTNVLQGYLKANGAQGAGGAFAIQSPVSMVFLDSPATTSPTTYKTQAWVDLGLRVVCQDSSVRSTITLIEVTA